ncbi:hypothetical protein GCM10010282_66830 [Streptomyces roseolus]|nr:hypothetical protein GCM10010282_66830 [Streptomyces roseolus]
MSEVWIRLNAADRRKNGCWTAWLTLVWAEVVRVEKRGHAARSSTWWGVRVVRLRGRDPPVPGAFTSRRYDGEFDRKLVLIEDYMRRTVER